MEQKIEKFNELLLQTFQFCNTSHQHFFLSYYFWFNEFFRTIVNVVSSYEMDYHQKHFTVGFKEKAFSDGKNMKQFKEPCFHSCDLIIGNSQMTSHYSALKSFYNIC